MMLQAYDLQPRVVRVLAAFAQVERMHGKKAMNYQGLSSVLKQPEMKLRFAVARAIADGVVTRVKLGKGRGDKSAFALTAHGRELAELK